MKKLVVLMLVLLLYGCSSSNTFVNEKISNIDIKKDGTVVILATGGTIAGSGEKGKETGYTSGALSLDTLIEAVPELEDIANIEAIQVCNVNSDDITDKIWIELANTINSLADNPKVLGFVITHGTDTLEETAYFLNLTVKTNKPVVLTGSMRPATSISADGPMNLYQSVCVAANEDSKDKGVLVCFSDKIYAARSTAKISTYNVMAISANETGSIGIVRDNNVYYYEEPIKRHTIESEFDVSNINELPKVNIIYFAVDASSKILEYAAKNSDGIIVAGAGAGEFSKEYIEVINNLSIPVVISSRIDDGLITQDSVLCSNTIAANNLSPQKAAVLLRLALLKTNSNEELIRIFSEY